MLTPCEGQKNSYRPCAPRTAVLGDGRNQRVGGVACGLASLSERYDEYRQTVSRGVCTVVSQ
eukprot:7328082-Prymnesium_polylepis.3